MSLFDKRCNRCGTQNLRAYTLNRNSLTCLNCFADEVESRRELIDEIDDISPVEAPYGYMSIMHKYKIEKTWEMNASLYGWDN